MLVLSSVGVEQCSCVSVLMLLSDIDASCSYLFVVVVIGVRVD